MQLFEVKVEMDQWSKFYTGPDWTEIHYRNRIEIGLGIIFQPFYETSKFSRRKRHLNFDANDKINVKINSRYRYWFQKRLILIFHVRKLVRFSSCQIVHLAQPMNSLFSYNDVGYHRHSILNLNLISFKMDVLQTISGISSIKSISVGYGFWAIKFRGFPLFKVHSYLNACTVVLGTLVLFYKNLE